MFRLQHAQVKVKLLLVDDEPSILRAMLRLLRRDFDVTTAGSGEQALSICERFVGFDVVMTDTNMHGMDGFELARRLVELRPELEGSIVITSGDPSNRERAEALGLTFLQKPFSAREITQVLERFAPGVQIS